MEYNQVNNPFIKLKNYKTEQEFTVDLTKSVPELDNNPNMSNLKKSHHTLYSDNRADKMRVDEDESTFVKYSITLIDIDNIIYEYFTKVINPSVLDQNGTRTSVPVRHASPERWSAIQRDGFLRDDKGQIQRPIIVFTRTSVSKDDSFAHFNKYLSVPFAKKYSSKNAYDRFSELTQINPMYEVHNVTFPDHVVLEYEFRMSTDYVQQMNELIEIINFSEGDYWGDPKRFKFRAKIDSFTNETEVSSDDDRSVNSTFSLSINAYLLPEIFDNQKLVKRSLTDRKVIWGMEIDEPPRLENNSLINNYEGGRSLLLNRKLREVTLFKKYKKYDIRLWNDVEVYNIIIDGNIFKIKPDEDNIGKFLIWDYLQTEVEIRPLSELQVEISKDIKVIILLPKNNNNFLRISF